MDFARLLLTLLLACSPVPALTGDPAGDPPGPADPSGPAAAIRFELTEPFVGDGLTLHAPRRVGGYGAFDVVAADMDLDGDPDVLINWHLGGIELCENRDGALVVLNTPEADVSGLGDQPGVPSLFARRGETLEQLPDDLAPGVYVWHEKALIWSLCLVPPPAGEVGPLTLRCNNEFSRVQGLLEGEELSPDGKGLSLRLKPGAARRLLQLGNDYPCANLRLQQDAESPWPYYVGRLPTRLATPAVSLRKPDPHGVAWVQALGSPEPELILTRGGNRGTLAPPDPPKSNRVFVHTGQRPPYRQLDPRRAPRDYARGRSVEWVDIDNDGTNELSIGNKGSANALWFLDRQRGRFRNGAPKLGLDHWFGDVSAWFDIDGDGWQDQLLLTRTVLQLSLNPGPGGGRFERSSPAEFGLDLGEPFEVRRTGFEKTCVSVFDLDADGDLDVWLSSLGAAGFHRVFRRQAEGFVDVTAALGLSGLEATEGTVRLDVDDDGYIDVLALGRPPLLLWNRGGERFEQLPLSTVVPGLPSSEALEDHVFAGTAADVDGDGRDDLILIGQSRMVAYNRTDNGNGRLIVHLRQGQDEPVGALLRLETDDGRVLLQRYGSARRSFVSQSLPPLHFGLPAGSVVTALEVLWPGELEWTRCTLPESGEVWLRR